MIMLVMEGHIVLSSGQMEAHMLQHHHTHYTHMWVSLHFIAPLPTPPLSPVVYAAILMD